MKAIRFTLAVCTLVLWASASWAFEAKKAPNKTPKTTVKKQTSLSQITKLSVEEDTVTPIITTPSLDCFTDTKSAPYYCKGTRYKAYGYGLCCDWNVQWWQIDGLKKCATADAKSKAAMNAIAAEVACRSRLDSGPCEDCGEIDNGEGGEEMGDGGE